MCPKTSPCLIPSLDIDQATRAILIHKRDGGPAVPENPLARLIADSAETTMLPSRNAALARMRTARIVALRRHFDRTHLNSEVA